MSDSPVLDGGVRFPEVITIRLPAGFLARIRLAAEMEAIAPPDFARRAVSERLLRLEAAARQEGVASPASSEPKPPAAARGAKRRDA